MKTFLIVLAVVASWLAAQRWLLPQCQDGECDSCLPVPVPNVDAASPKGSP
ncbi:MAG: hypothetical protein KDK97_10080 [Verrucomicrobiales bacterium]|nr:hypothetical protein [Verrucomicrobiales bacterium]MCP5556873.1 hypothetical protein [Verrucomicrobiaceae bacterium]